MKLIVTLSITILISVQITAQIDTTLKEFCLLHVGDTRQYRNQDNFLSTAQILKDTILDGYKYYVITGGGTRTLGGITRIDSVLRVQTRWGDL